MGWRRSVRCRMQTRSRSCWRSWTRGWALCEHGVDANPLHSTPLHAVNTGKVLLMLTPREVLLFEHCALHSCDGFASEGWGGAVSLGCGVIFREPMWFTNHETRCNTHRIRFGVV